MLQFDDTPLMLAAHDGHGDIVDLLIKAGYDPNPCADFFSVLGAEEGESSFLSFLSTHPDPADRAEDLRERISQMDNVPDFTGDTEAWNAFIASL